jgi:opine dehydrogenase
LLSTVNFLANLLPDFEKRPQPKLSDKSEKTVCIVGDGMYGLAVASLMSARCKQIDIVRLPRFDVIDEPLFAYNDGRGLSEHRDSLERLRGLVVEPNDKLFEAEYIILTGGVGAFDYYISLVQTHLRDGQNLVIINAPIGAGLQFTHALSQAGLHRRFNVAELGDLFYGVRTEGDLLVVGSVRARSNFAGNTRNQLRKNIAIDALLPIELIPSSNLIERGLFEVERILRPALLLFGILGERAGVENTNGLARTVSNDATLALLQRLETEVAALGRAYKSAAPAFATIGETARRTSQADNGRIPDKKFEQVVESYYANLTSSISLSVNPARRARSIVTKDLSEHVVILSELARVARLGTPALDSLIEFASGIADMDIRSRARTLSDLGLDGLSLSDIVEYVNA